MKVYNCPNCGAPITNEKCPYCGTIIYDFTVIDTQHPCYIKIKDNDKIIILKAQTKDVELNCINDYYDIYGGNNNHLVDRLNNNSLELSMNFNCIPIKNNNLCKVIQL